jgi:hypothetical protein
MKKLSKIISTFLLSLSIFPIFYDNAEAKSRIIDLKDVRTDHWAYNAIKELVEKYDVMSGFPDGTFKGARTFTRYEAAAALYKVMLKMEEMTSGMTFQNIPNQDLLVLKSLSEEFRKELDALKSSDKEQNDKIKSLEDELSKIKEEIGTVKFGGDFSAGFDDTLEDNFRPGYWANYTFDMKANIMDNGYVKARFNGSFSSEVKPQDNNGQTTNKDVEESSLGFGTAWFNYSPRNVLFNPKVRFGYMNLGNLISSGTGISHSFPGSTSLANPNLNSGAKKRGIRVPTTVSGGVEFGSGGPFSLTLAATPNTFATQAKLDFGAFKMKLVADADQTMFVGELVQDPMHNEAIIIDIGGENFGLSAQANFRGIADDWQWRAASGLLYMNLWNFKIGAVGKFENESNQQLIVGSYIKTPDKAGDNDIPSLLVALQEPLTILNGSIYEGSNIGDKAGIYVELSWENPFLPGLTIYFDQKSNILFSDDPKDIIANTYGISTYMSF